MVPKYKFDYQKLKHLFNLGLHLNNPQEIFSTQETKYSRAGNLTQIKNPIYFYQLLTTLTRILKKVISHKEKIAIINTHQSYTGFAEIFEGIGIQCFEEPWEPGSLSNSILGHEKPTVLIFVSARRQDFKIVVAEIENSEIPVINLSDHPFTKTLYHPIAFPNKNQIWFYLEFIHFLIYTCQKKNRLYHSTTLPGENLLEFDQQINALFTFLQQDQKKLACLPKWISK